MLEIETYVKLREYFVVWHY